MTLAISASDIFRSAYQNRYTWDENFPGYTADVTVKTGGKVETGKVKIDADLSFAVEEIDDEELAKAVKNQLWEITIHRVNHSFDKSHGENTFELGEKDEKGAVKIIVGGAGAGNSYKVKDNTVTFVHRRIGNKIVNIDTTKTLDTGNGYLALDYSSVYVDPETEEAITPETQFNDEFTQVGDYFVLSNRKITTQGDNSQVTEYQFTNFSLLS